MASNASPEPGLRYAAPALPPGAPLVKIVIGGGYGVGKTTFVRNVSETAGMFTEADMTRAAEGVDDLVATPRKKTTTVSMDFGRITLNEDQDPVVLYLFGLPGQQRFAFLWKDLLEGAVGAVVLVDTGRVADCFPALQLLEHRRLPYVVAINRFPGAPLYPRSEIRDALQLSERVPIVDIDARRRDQGADALKALIHHLLDLPQDDDGHAA